MFTGIVETTALTHQVQSGRLVIANPWDRDLSLGQSISVNGCCLTIVQFDSESIEFDVSSETLNRTSFGQAKPGTLLNLERAMKVGGTLDGHWVTGHIDTTGTVRSLRDVADGSKEMWVDVKPLVWVVEKGSVALDGISLTVNDVDAHGFSVVLIPHTQSVTSFKNLKAGSVLNVEFDLLAKYIDKILAQRTLSREAHV